LIQCRPLVGVKDWDGKFVLVNQETAQSYNTTVADLEGKTDADFIQDASQVAAFLRDDREVMSTGKSKFIAAEPLTTTGKVTRWMQTTKVPLQSTLSTKPQLLFVSMDVTARQHAEERLRDHTHRLEQSNRELEDFAYVASHDLQEPLRKIQAFGGRLKNKFGEHLPEEGRDYVARMQSAAGRMQTLISDLLEFSRITTKARPFAPVDLNRTLLEVVSDLEMLLEQTGGTIEIGELPILHADAVQMRQLMQNLCGNALKFHRKDVTPHVRVHLLTPEFGERFANFGTNQESNYDENTKLSTQRSTESSTHDFFQILVEDNGIGFDEKYLDRIFTPFQRLHGRETYSGTGIGLAICRKIVERHGGSITARSQPGTGTTFVITLPKHHDGNVAHEPERTLLS
jgi:light-regulated signal transduction histidine kinase (bacteriophytochrome)